MTSRRLARAGLAALVAAVAGSAPTVARAQGVGKGKALELPVLGARIEVPAGGGEWIARKDDGGDVVQRTRPADPYLSVLFSVPDESASCASTMAAFARKGLQKLDRPELSPSGWSTEILTARTGGQNLIAFCADGAPPLVALVTYAASVESDDLAAITPILAAVGKAVLAPPVPTSTLTLPRSGLQLVVGAGWEAKAGKSGRDLVRRTAPEDPALSVAIEIVEASPGGCEAILDRYLATRGKGSLENRPSYLPEGFHANVAEIYTGGSGRALACAEVPAGYLLATVIYAGSLADADADAARPVLLAAYRAAAALAGKRERRYPVLTGHSFYSPELYLAGQRLVPASDAFEAGNGVLAGVRQAGMLRWAGSRFGLAGRFHIAGGWDARHHMIFDGSIAIGVGVALGPVVLMPMFGGGGDAIGAGATPADDRIDLAFHLYDFFGGVVEVELNDVFAVELTGGYCDRGERRELRYETRVLALPGSFPKVSLGLSYLQIEKVATLWQLLVGVGF